MGLLSAWVCDRRSGWDLVLLVNVPFGEPRGPCVGPEQCPSSSEFCKNKEKGIFTLTSPTRIAREAKRNGDITSSSIPSKDALVLGFVKVNVRSQSVCYTCFQLGCKRALILAFCSLLLVPPGRLSRLSCPAGVVEPLLGSVRPRTPRLLEGCGKHPASLRTQRQDRISRCAGTPLWVTLPPPVPVPRVIHALEKGTNGRSGGFPAPAPSSPPWSLGFRERVE